LEVKFIYAAQEFEVKMFSHFNLIKVINYFYCLIKNKDKLLMLKR